MNHHYPPQPHNKAETSYVGHAPGKLFTCVFDASLVFGVRYHLPPIRGLFHTLQCLPEPPSLALHQGALTLPLTDTVELGRAKLIFSSKILGR